MELLRGKDGYVLGMPGREHEKPPCSWLQKKLQKVLNELFNTDETPKEDRAVIHTLRHSVASRMLEKGVPLEIVSKTLDHSSIAITAQVYGKISPNLIHQSVKGLWD
jgi:site-specific recombinase XerD